MSPGSGKKTQYGVSFSNVTGEELDIQSIVCKNNASNPTTGAFKLWWWDSTEGTYKKAKYVNTKIYADDGTSVDGTKYSGRFAWVTDDAYLWWMVPAGSKFSDDSAPTVVDHSKTFKVGEGFFIQSGSATPKVTLAGQVVNPGATEPYYTLALSSGKKTQVVNPFPVSCDIQSIVCKNNASNPTTGAFKLWWWDSAEGTYKKAKYVNTKIYADDGTSVDGTKYSGRFAWVTDDAYLWWMVPAGSKFNDDSAPTVVDHSHAFAVGEGFFVQSGSATPKLLFPNPFYTAD